MKYAAYLLLSLLLLSVASVAIAEEETATVDSPESELQETVEIEQEAEASLNEEVSGADISMQQLKVWFTFNQEKKAQQELQLAKMQLIRAKIAARNGDTNAMNKALEAHERIMARVQERVEKIVAKDSSQNLTGLQRAIQVHMLRMEKINLALQKENLTEQQRTRLEMQLGKIENVTGKLEAVQAKIRERQQQRIREPETHEGTEEQIQEREQEQIQAGKGSQGKSSE